MKDEIKILMIKKNTSIAKVAEDLNMSSQNLYNQIRRNNFRISMLKDIAKSLDVGLEIRFKINEDESQDIVWRN